MPLTANQQAVAQHHQDHALCIAVAGSGKTTTLSHLIKQLLNKGNDPRRIMVMMFNKAAQQDFQKKLQGVASDVQQRPEVRTYHATGLRLLRTLESWQVRPPYQKKPLSEKAIELQIRRLIQSSAPGTIQERMRSDAPRIIEAAVGFIDSVKANLTTPEAWFEDSGYSEEHHFLMALYHQFEQWRHQQRSITFTDMLYDPVCLITEQPELIARVENKMDYIVVDEYQDTSTLQHRFTQLIAGDRANVIAVGDPDQTIYEFAGANINNILNHFQQDYGRTRPVHERTIPHTFRYGHSIALAASHLISRNKARKAVICQAHPDNPASSIRVTQTKYDDSKAVIHAIEDYLASGIASQDIAILVRVWAQSVPIELSLLEAGITYCCAGPSLFQRPELETLVCALKMAAGLLSATEPDIRKQVFNRLLTLPHIGLKQHDLTTLVDTLQQQSGNYGKTLARLASQLKGISDFQVSKIRDRAMVFQYLEQTDPKVPARQILSTYVEQTELYDSLRSMSLNEQRTEEQILAIKGFQRFIRPLGENALECCQHIEALNARQGQQQHRQALTLSSCHRAKGLEWPVVLIPGLTCQYWPFLRDDDLSALSQSQPARDHLEAERRLLYVGMTRARSELHLLTAQGDLSASRSSISQPSWNRSRQDTISPLLLDMNLPHVLALSHKLHNADDEALIETVNNTGLSPVSRRYLSAVRPAIAQHIAQAPTLPSSTTRQRSGQQNTGRRPAVSTNEPWQPKARIEHAIFGSGRVIEVNDNNFTIAFDSRQHGTKRFVRSPQISHLFKAVDSA